MLMALKPEHLAKAIAGMKQLAKNGLRYPIAPLWYPGRRTRRHGCFVREEIGLRKQLETVIASAAKQSMLR
jgi:hypothetical protein